MDFFQNHAVLFALIAAAAGVSYGVALIVWLLRQPTGTERMREISHAVQEGAAAYLRKQYTTIAIVSVIPFLTDRLLRQARLGNGNRLSRRRSAFGGGGIHRHERVGALECPHRRSGQGRAQAGLQDRLPRRLGDGTARGRPRTARRGRLLLDSHCGLRQDRSRGPSTIWSVWPSEAR